MTIKQFIEKATEGGWGGYKNANRTWLELNPETVLLDPLAWQAVGKVEGWEALDYTRFTKLEEYRWQQHAFLDALQEGKTIEQYLETL